MNFPKSAHWQPALHGDGFVEGLADVEQCMSIILMTPLGSEPLRPDFGSNIHLYVDWPIDRARPHMVRETVDAIRKWETRVTVTKVQVLLVDITETLIRTFYKLADGIERFFEVRP